MTRGPYKLVTKGMTEEERSAWFREEGKRATALQRAGFREDPYIASIHGRGFAFLDGLGEHHGCRVGARKKKLYWQTFQGDECVAQWYRQAGFPSSDR